MSFEKLYYGVSHDHITLQLHTDMPPILVFRCCLGKLLGTRFKIAAYFLDEFEISWDALSTLDSYLELDHIFHLYPAYAELADNSLHLFDIWAS